MMDKPKSRVPWLIGMALGLLAALLIVPATRWTVRMEAAAALFRGGASSAQLNNPDRSDPNANAVADRHPRDFQLALAAALRDGAGYAWRGPNANEAPESAPPARIDTARVRDLEARFADNPSLYANKLRYMAWGSLRPQREEEDLLQGDKPGIPPKTQPSASLLEEYDHAAAEGERLDPDNAYFPFMRSVGLFAAHRDAEALAAIERASEKPRWDEYYQDEVEGKWRLDEMTGHGGILNRMVTAMAVLFPHYAALRGSMRVATYLAMKDEMAGNTERGFEIRRSLRRCGSLMRADSRTLIGNLVGSAIANLSMSRPAGAPPIKSTGSGSSRDTNRQRLEQYTAYLERIGHPEEAQACRQEDAAREQIRGLAKKLATDPIQALARMFGWWAAGIAALCNAIWMLLFGGAAAQLYRSRRLREGRALTPETRAGIAAGLLWLAGLGAVMALAPDAFIVVLALLIVGLAGLAVLAWRRRAFKLMGGVGAAAITLLAVFLVGAAAVFHAGSVMAVGNQVSAMLGNNDNPSEPLVPLAALLVIAVPLLVALVATIFSAIIRVPISVGLVRGFRGLAVPVACVLVLLWGASVIAAMPSEGTVDRVLVNMMHGEGQSMAQAQHAAWPGVIK